MLSKLSRAVLLQGRAMSTQLTSPPQNPSTTAAVENQKFHLKMAVKNYSPEEVKVKVVDGYLVVEGRHEEAGPQGKTTKEFTKWLKIPDDVDTTTLEHNVSPDGILSLSAAKKKAIKPS